MKSGDIRFECMTVRLAAEVGACFQSVTLDFSN